jgi:hypothetical protein
MKKDVRERIREKINGRRAAGNKRDRKYASEEIIDEFINPFFLSDIPAYWIVENFFFW